MRKLLHELWTKPFGEYEDKNIRLLALMTGLLLHIAGITVVWMLVRSYMPAYNNIPISRNDLGGMSGGGGGDSKERVIEFGPAPGDEESTEEEKFKPEKVRIIRLRIVRPESEGTPVIAKVEEPKKKEKKQKSHMGSSLVTNLPPRHVRGNGEGSGGGAGGGKGGGIGKGSGYSIDWGGTGNRRLISGRVPQYPKGTDKQMPVTLQFVVLPDGSVSKIIPLTKGDELLERAAIAALETWRFDPLPMMNDPKIQAGRITFNFKLEQSASRISND